jgi:hypothetical protein
MTSADYETALEFFGRNILGVRVTEPKYLPRSRRLDELNLLRRGLKLPLPAIFIMEAERRSAIA